MKADNRDAADIYRRAAAAYPPAHLEADYIAAAGRIQQYTGELSNILMDLQNGRGVPPALVSNACTNVQTAIPALVTALGSVMSMTGQFTDGMWPAMTAVYQALLNDLDTRTTKLLERKMHPDPVAVAQGVPAFSKQDFLLMVAEMARRENAHE